MSGPIQLRGTQQPMPLSNQRSFPGFPEREYMTPPPPPPIGQNPRGGHFNPRSNEALSSRAYEPRPRPKAEVLDLRSEDITEADAREKVSSFFVVSIKQADVSDELDDEGYPLVPSWDKALHTFEDVSKHEATRKVRELVRTTPTVNEKKKDLPDELQRHLDGALRKLERTEEDPRFCYTLAQFECKVKKIDSSPDVHRHSDDRKEKRHSSSSHEGKDKNRKRDKSKSKSKHGKQYVDLHKSKPKRRRQIILVTAYLKRIPGPEENCINMLKEQKARHASPPPKSVPTLAQRHPPLQISSNLRPPAAQVSEQFRQPQQAQLPPPPQENRTVPLVIQDAMPLNKPLPRQGGAQAPLNHGQPQQPLNVPEKTEAPDNRDDIQRITPSHHMPPPQTVKTPQHLVQPSQTAQPPPHLVQPPRGAATPLVPQPVQNPQDLHASTPFGLPQVKPAPPPLSCPDQRPLEGKSGVEAPKGQMPPPPPVIHHVQKPRAEPASHPQPNIGQNPALGFKEGKHGPIDTRPWRHPAEPVASSSSLDTSSYDSDFFYSDEEEEDIMTPISSKGSFDDLGRRLSKGAGQKYERPEYYGTARRHHGSPAAPEHRIVDPASVRRQVAASSRSHKSIPGGMREDGYERHQPTASMKPKARHGPSPDYSPSASASPSASRFRVLGDGKRYYGRGNYTTRDRLDRRRSSDFRTDDGYEDDEYHDGRSPRRWGDREAMAYMGAVDRWRDSSPPLRRHPRIPQQGLR